MPNGWTNIIEIYHRGKMKEFVRPKSNKGAERCTQGGLAGGVYRGERVEKHITLRWCRFLFNIIQFTVMRFLALFTRHFTELN